MSGRHGQLTWQLQSLEYSLPGTAVFMVFGTTACQQHPEVALSPALPGMGSLGAWRGALVAAHSGGAVAAVHGSAQVRYRRRGIKY